MQYNPQLKLEFSLLNDDGNESDMTIDLFQGIDGYDSSDLNYHAGNKPIAVECNIQKSLGGGQQTADIVIHNSPYIETFRNNYKGELEKIRNQKWRVRIYAWYDDNGSVTQSPRPSDPPVFVGDITEDFVVTSSGINDTSLQLQATGHGWLANSGKMKQTWQAGTTYLEIVNDLFDYMLNEKNYGRETRASTPKKVILNTGELNNTFKRGFSINRNPCEVMNDICRDLDCVWGINNNIPYIMLRSNYFLNAEAPIESQPTEFNYFVDGRGMTSLVNFSKYTFSFSALWFNNFIVGGTVSQTEAPQVNSQDLVLGRINEISIKLDNFNGHTTDLTCSYHLGAGQVVLPPKRADNSGLRYE